MSAAEPNGAAERESASSVKLSRNAAGKTQIEVKVYAGEDDDQLAAVMARAQDVYDTLAAKYRGGS